MTFDDRLRDELRRATERHDLDTDGALRRVKSDEPVAITLEENDVASRRRLSARRLVAVAAAVVVIGGAVALPLALRDRSHDTVHRTTRHKTTKNQLNAERVAFQAVASALDATTAAGSFRVVFSLTEHPGTAQTTTTTACVTTPGSIGAGATGYTGGQYSLNEICGYTNSIHNVTTTGVATVNVHPFAMVAVSKVSNFGDVTVRVDDSGYWETSGETGLGLVPNGTLGASSPISSFAGLVEGTLGRREGAEAMMGLASPTGYLSITREAITGAKQIGTGTIDGEPVTNFQVTVDSSRLANDPGLSAEELKTINAALVVLHDEGFTGNTTDVSVDANGRVVHTKSTNTYADGGTVVSEDTFSAFGCAGAVQLPGRPVTTPLSLSCITEMGPKGGKDPVLPTGPTGAASGSPSGGTGVDVGYGGISGTTGLSYPLGSGPSQ